LSKHVGDIVVGITAVVEFRAESAWHSCVCNDIVSVWTWRMNSLELQLAYATDLRSHLEG